MFVKNELCIVMYVLYDADRLYVIMIMIIIGNDFLVL